MSFGTAGHDEPDRRSEICALIEAAGLSRPVDCRALDELVEMQATLHARQEELAQMFLVSKISRKDYASQLDSIMTDAARAGERVLGFDDFHKVFGDFSVQDMIDVNMFVAAPLAR